MRRYNGCGFCATEPLSVFFFLCSSSSSSFSLWENPRFGYLPLLCPSLAVESLLPPLMLFLLRWRCAPSTRNHSFSLFFPSTRNQIRRTAVFPLSFSLCHLRALSFLGNYGREVALLITLFINFYFNSGSDEHVLEHPIRLGIHGCRS